MWRLGMWRLRMCSEGARATPGVHRRSPATKPGANGRYGGREAVRANTARDEGRCGGATHLIVRVQLAIHKQARRME